MERTGSVVRAILFATKNKIDTERFRRQGNFGQQPIPRRSALREKRSKKHMPSRPCQTHGTNANRGVPVDVKREQQRQTTFSLCAGRAPTDSYDSRATLPASSSSRFLLELRQGPYPGYPKGIAFALSFRRACYELCVVVSSCRNAETSLIFLACAADFLVLVDIACMFQRHHARIVRVWS